MTDHPSADSTPETRRLDTKTDESARRRHGSLLQTLANANRQLEQELLAALDCVQDLLPRAAQPVRVLQFPADGSRCSLPLTLRPQRVSLASVRGSDEIWVTAVGLVRGSAIVLHATLRSSTAPQPLLKRIHLLPGRATLLLACGECPGALDVELARESGNFCIVALERRASRSGITLEELVASATAAQHPGGRTLSPEEPPKNTKVSVELEGKLWGGYASHGVPLLEQIRNDAGAPIAERREAAWYLSRWFYYQQDYGRALDSLAFAKTQATRPEKRFVLAEVQCLMNAGRHRDAMAVLETHEHLLPEIDYHLLRSTAVRQHELATGAPITHAESAQLSELNRCFHLAGLLPIEKKDRTRPLTLANIQSVAPSACTDDRKVSVIVPAHNAAATIGWALESLLHQSWANIEIVVVDDGSTDGTADVVASLAARDPRVRLVRKAQNEGAYAARNEGLRRATGELITVQDSDDWSHPQRIELQVRALESRNDVVAVMSHWLRVTETLEVIGIWIPKGVLHTVNFSSLLFRQELLDVLGPWDEVRVGADAEFYSRIRAVFGNRSVVTLPADQLLALSLGREDSLTQSAPTHLRTINHGLRWQYRDGYLYWHSKLALDMAQLPLAAVRRFPAPLGNTSKPPSTSYDVVVIADFAATGDELEVPISYVRAARRAGMAVAVFHWPSFRRPSRRRLDPRLYELCMEASVQILTWGDAVESRMVLCTEPAILEHELDPLPRIETPWVVTLVDYLPSVEHALHHPYDPTTVGSRIRSIFATEAIWSATSTWLKSAMAADTRVSAASTTVWYPPVDDVLLDRPAIRWRGRERNAPIVGVYCGNVTELTPSAIDTLQMLASSAPKFDVRILGNERATLGDLDFYVVLSLKAAERVAYSLYEALAIGVPAILPRQWADWFEHAAAYSSATNLVDAITSLWSSEQKYCEQSANSKRFAAAYCSTEAISRRLQGLWLEG